MPTNTKFLLIEVETLEQALGVATSQAVDYMFIGMRQLDACACQFLRSIRDLPYQPPFITLCGQHVATETGNDWRVGLEYTMIPDIPDRTMIMAMAQVMATRP